MEISWASLRGQVGAFAATLRRLGVQPGDRVAGYLPNVPEAVVAFLGAASIGAVWSSCAPDFGTRAVLDRFAQIEPTVLVAVDGYRFNGKDYDRRDVVAELRAALPTVRTTIAVPRLFPDEVPDGALPWADAVADEQDPEFAALPFDHPLWIVYSSGTTGLPKGIVHGHGGVVLEQRKQAALHMDIGPGDRFFWYASTAWIMWNIAASALLTGATVVVYDGAPAYPSVDAQFALAARTGITFFGTSPGYLGACEKAGERPGEKHDLSALRSIGVTGSPLPSSTFRWVYDAVKPDVFLGSLSGGTDVATGFIGSSPLLPVTVGELQRPMLAVAAAAWNEDGEPVVGRARGAGGDRADAVDAAATSGTTPATSATARPTSSRGPASGGTATGWRSPTAAPASSPAARTPRSTAAACAWAPPTSTRRSSRSPPSSTASSSGWSSPTAATGCRCSCSSRPGEELTDELRDRAAGRRSASRPARGTCPTRSSPSPECRTPAPASGWRCRSSGCSRASTRRRRSTPARWTTPRWSTTTSRWRRTRAGGR